MSMTIAERQAASEVGQGNLTGLAARLASLAGQPFQFIQMSYGDEATFHFGETYADPHPKLKGVLFGEFGLGMRASKWILTTGRADKVIAAGISIGTEPSKSVRPLPKSELEAGTFILPGSRVLAAEPFEIKPMHAFGLHVRFSDGSTLVVMPAARVPDGPDEADFPPLADWELFTPQGLLSAWPDLKWTFEVETATKLPEPVPADQTTPIPDPASTPAVTST